jgi:hypothetical protein
MFDFWVGIFLSPPQCPGRHCSPSSLISNRRSGLQRSRREPDYSYKTSVGIENAWSYTSTAPYAIILCLTKAKANFYINFLSSLAFFLYLFPTTFFSSSTSFLSPFRRFFIPWKYPSLHRDANYKNGRV